MRQWLQERRGGQDPDYSRQHSHGDGSRKRRASLPVLHPSLDAYDRPGEVSLVFSKAHGGEPGSCSLPCACFRVQIYVVPEIRLGYVGIPLSPAPSTDRHAKGRICPFPGTETTWTARSPARESRPGPF